MPDIYGLAFILKSLLICVYWLETINQTLSIRIRVFFACANLMTKKKLFWDQWSIKFSPLSHLLIPINSTKKWSCDLLVLFLTPKILTICILIFKNISGKGRSLFLSLPLFSDYFFLGTIKSHILMDFYLFTYFWTPSDWFIIVNGVVPTHTFTCS